MKKLLGILLLALFVFTIFFSINNNISTSNDSPGYASIIPIPPPDPPAQRGC